MSDRTPLPPRSATDSDLWLAEYGLAAGTVVEVELLVVGQPSQVGPRLVEGTVERATAAVLILAARTGAYRIPWRAIATIRNAVPHPGL